MFIRASLFHDLQNSPVTAPAAPSAPEPLQPPSAVEAAVAAARERLGQQQAAAAVTPDTTPASEGAVIAPVAPPADTPQTAGIDWSTVDWSTFDLVEAERADPTLLFIPPRAPGMPPTPVQLDQPELIEDMRRWRNDGMRGAEYAEAMRELDAREDQLHALKTAIRVDPVGFALNQMRPEDQTRMAMAVLTHRDVWPNMVGTLKSLIGDPTKLEAARARLENMSLRATKEAEDTVREERFARQNAADLRRAVHALVPRNLTKEQAGLWRDNARHALRDYAQRNNLATIDVRDVPAVLATHLSAFNVAPEEAWARMRAAFTGGSTSPIPASATPTHASAAGTPAARPVQTPRQAAAMIVPAGAGAPAARLPQPPAGQTVPERLEWLKQNAGVLRRA